MRRVPNGVVATFFGLFVAFLSLPAAPQDAAAQDVVDSLEGDLSVPDGDQLPESAVPETAAERARRLFLSAVQAADAGEWERARDLFQASRDAMPRASTDFNLAGAHVELGEYEAARRALVQYRQRVSLDPPGPERDEALARADALEEQIAAASEVAAPPEPTRPRQTRIEVTSLQPAVDPSRASAQVDARSLTPTDAPTTERRRRRWPWWVAATVIVGTGVALGVVFLRDPGGGRGYCGTAQTCL